MILAGDIGGTKTLLSLYEKSKDAIHTVREATYRSRDHAAFEEILRQ